MSDENVQSYIDGRQVESHAHHHVMPLSLYMKVFGALMFLTVATVAVSFADLGGASIYVAMFVALIKAALVVGFFMHLKYDDKFHAVVFFGSLLFVVIFFGLTFADLTTRDEFVPEWGNKAHMEDHFQGFPEAAAGHGDIHSPTEETPAPEAGH